jgi:hypothetical protein
MEEKKKQKEEAQAPPAKRTGGATPFDGDRLTKIIITAYLFVISTIIVIVAVMIWPPQDQNPSEAQLILIVVIFGALGSVVHALRSFSWHVVEQGEWGTNWLLRYFLMPPTGAAIALLFYAIVRGGFYTPGSEQDATLPWIFAAVAAIVGMFKEAASSKLKDIAQAILKKPPDPIKDRERGRGEG